MKLYVPILITQGSLVYEVPDGLSLDKAVEYVKKNQVPCKPVIQELKPNMDAARLTEEIHRNYGK